MNPQLLLRPLGQSVLERESLPYYLHIYFHSHGHYRCKTKNLFLLLFICPLKAPCMQVLQM